MPKAPRGHPARTKLSSPTTTPSGSWFGPTPNRRHLRSAASEFTHSPTCSSTGCTRRNVVRKIAAGIPAFHPDGNADGILDTLDSQHRAAEQLRLLVAQSAAAA